MEPNRVTGERLGDKAWSHKGRKLWSDHWRRFNWGKDGIPGKIKGGQTGEHHRYATEWEGLAHWGAGTTKAETGTHGIGEDRRVAETTIRRI